MIKKYVALMLFLLVSLAFYSQAEGYPVSFENSAAGSSIWSALSLNAYGGLFLSAAAVISCISAIKAFVWENRPYKALFNLVITLMIIGIFKVLV